MTAPVSKKRSRPLREQGRPKGVKGADTRREIISAARLLIETVGYEETSLSMVAEHLGLTRTAIYNYFSSKYELAKAIALEESEGRYGALMGRPWWRDKTPEDLSATGRLRYLLGRSLHDAHTSPFESDFYTRLISSSREDPEVREAIEGLVRDQRAVFRAILEKGVADGEIADTADLDAYLDAVQGIVWALSIGMTSAPNSVVRDQVVRALDLIQIPTVA